MEHGIAAGALVAAEGVGLGARHERVNRDAVVAGTGPKLDAGLKPVLDAISSQPRACEPSKLTRESTVLDGSIDLLLD